MDKARTWIDGGWTQSPYAKNVNGVLGIDTDGFYGFQCKDLVNAYGEFLGHPFTAGNASALWDWQQDPFWQRIPADQTPQPGDVFVRTFIADGNEYDHTGVIRDVDGAGFTSLDQNWFNSSLTKGSPPALVHHGFDQIRGYLRPQENIVELFNEGDRLNLNAYFYGQDMGRFKGAIGLPWKQAMYFGIFETPDFKVDALVNSGDVPAINDVYGAGDGQVAVGRTWKDLFYDYARKHKVTTVQAQLDALKADYGKTNGVDPNAIIITTKGWAALGAVIKSFFAKNN